ncbi:putative short-chain dehydrogenases protein [Eutypa lata UCREL1]|uniref:Putative short-chain dehydrogenases protein n=1 Tax=Eutypa lata (strain UCR-EL1) TaxID=1287681 RepID=M7SE86_EUTLA|nr:putative short-chain dehydrogenases protein [Eutypa lata UCREL1]
MVSHKRTILITGCSEGGAGHALALEFAAKGFRVFATARSTKSLASLEAKGIEILTLDVTQPESISLLKAEISKRTRGTLDILFNNAGMMYESPAIEAETSQVRAMFDTNVFGLFAMVEAFTPLLLASTSNSPSQPPTIINTSSVVARLPYLFSAHYNATKAAVTSYSDTLRLELAPLGIKVVTVFMGVVRTGITSPDKIKFSPDSLYTAAEAGVKQRSKDHLSHGMDAKKFASLVAGDILNKRGLTKGNYVWQGTNAFVVWLLNAVGWRKIFDSTVEQGAKWTKLLVWI